MEHWEKCCNILWEINKISESKRLTRYLDKKSIPSWLPHIWWCDYGFNDLDKLLKTVSMED